jgi:hypothetical protein
MNKLNTIIPVFFIFISVHPLLSQSINTDVEVCEITWPGDWMLCDGYSESEGPMWFTMYRLKSTHKILLVEEHGAYCQGDSEYGSSHSFNSWGQAIYSEAGGNMYAPTTITILGSGKTILEVEYEPTEDQIPNPKRIIKKISSTEIITSDSYELEALSYLRKMQARADTLKKMKFGKKDAALKREADSIIVLLEESISIGITYHDGYEYRLPQAGEFALIKGTDIRVRSDASSESEVTAKVNCYDGHFKIEDIKGMETIDAFGKFPWYKIVYMDQKTGKEEKGWIFGAFILPGVYTKLK